jgi:competence protein ComEC
VIDARLLVPALAAWAGALALLLGGWSTVVAILCAASILIATAAMLRRSAPSSSLIVGVVFALVGAGAAFASVARLSPDPLPMWVAERATVSIVGAIAGEPRTMPAPRGAASWIQPSQIVRLHAQTLEARGIGMTASVPLQLRLRPDMSVPPRGSVIDVVGRLSDVPRRTGVAAEVRVRALSIRSPPGSLDASATAMRTGLAAAVSNAPPDAASLVRGLALGDDEGASEEFAAAMRASGLAHLVAVSGGNVAIVVGLTVGLATLVRLRLALRVLLGLLAVAYYAFLVGPEPSVLRASVMGAIVLVGVLVGGRRGGPAVLATGVLGLVLLQPSLALSWGFALSAAATAGIILLAPVWRRRLDRARLTRRWPPIVLTAISLTLAAQAATLPLLVAMGGATGWVSIPANLVAMPAVAPVTVLGLLAAVIAPVAPGVAGVLGEAAAWPARVIAAVAWTAPELPFSTWPGGDLPSGWAGMAVLGAMTALVLVVRAAGLGRRWRQLPGVHRAVAIALAATLVVLTLLRPPSARGWPPPDWLMIMCDVGQGDGLLLRSAPHSAVVIDTGSDADRVDACLADAGVVDVPAVILTHFHADHVAGLAGVLRNRRVGVILTTPVEEPREQARLIDSVLAGSGHSAQPVTAGDARRIGEVAWRALWPRRLITSGSIPNNASIVLVAEVSGRRLLLTGDIEPEAQRALILDVAGQSFDVVKVPHHGSRYQSPDFARAVRAPIVLISVGEDNEYGHPAREAIEMFSGDDSVVVRTDISGDAAIVESSAGGLGVVTRDGMLAPP